MNKIKEKNNKNFLAGVIAILAASVFFGIGYPLSSMIEASGMPKSANVFWLGVLSVIFNLILHAVKKNPVVIKLNWKQILTLAFAGFMTRWLQGFLFMTAYGYLAVEEVTLLHFLHPSLIAIFMTAFFKERFTWAKALAILCSLAGAVIITGGISSGSVVGIIAAVMTGVTYASYPILMQVGPFEEMKTETVILYMDLFGMLFAFIIAICSGTFSLPLSGTVLGCECGYALSAFIAYLCYGFSVKKIGATNAAFGSMFEPIASCIFAAIIFGSSLTLNILIGGICVMLSVLFCNLENTTSST